MKTPEEYLSEQIFSPDHTGPEEQFTPQEKIFLQKYLDIGLEEEKGGSIVTSTEKKSVSEPEATEIMDQAAEREEVSTNREKGIVPERQTGESPDFQPAPVLSGEAREKRLKSQEELQFVSFTLFRQTYALPIDEVQEVIRYITPTTIPTAPKFIAGMINLRGRVTPLVQMDALVHARGEGPDPSARFIVICRTDGLQIGMIIHTLSTMYRIPQRDIEWNIESRLGVGSELLCGLFKKDDLIIGIVDADKVVERVLKG
ncbi:MAG: chemotaxis protein CheW [Desulfovibrionales bacterium]